MVQLDDYEAGYLVGFAAGASLILVALWLANRASRTERERRQLAHLDTSVQLLRDEVAFLASRQPQPEPSHPKEDTP